MTSEIHYTFAGFLTWGEPKVVLGSWSRTENLIDRMFEVSRYENAFLESRTLRYNEKKNLILSEFESLGCRLD